MIETLLVLQGQLKEVRSRAKDGEQIALLEAPRRAVLAREIAVEEGVAEILTAKGQRLLIEVAPDFTMFSDVFGKKAKLGILPLMEDDKVHLKAAKVNLQAALLETSESQYEGERSKLLTDSIDTMLSLKDRIESGEFRA